MYREVSRFYILLMVGVLLSIAASLYSPSATALPPFARQTQNQCSACHFQHFPKLTQFGRIFKANGLSLSAQPEIEGDDLSIPAYLNATFFTRSKYIQTSDSSNTRNGTLAIPDEAAILVGGRLANGIGGVVEWGGPLLSSKLIFTRPMGAAGRMGLTVFTTDGLGPAYGFEVMNTGVVRNHRPFEQSSKVTLGNVDNLELAQAASGVSFFGFSPGKGFVSATLYTPDSNEAGLTHMDVDTNLSHYLRAAYMPQIGGWDVGIGAGIHSGATLASIADSDLASRCGIGVDEICKIYTRARFIDAQAQGNLLGRELGIYFIYAEGDDSGTKIGATNLFGGESGDSKPKGWGLDAEYSVTPHLHIIGSIGLSDNGSAGDKKMGALGLYWQIAQNISLQPMYETYRGTQGVDAEGDPVHQLTLSLEADF